VSTDAKTVKGEKKGVLTGILYLAPHNISGFQVCPKATEGCKLACLYTAGRAMMFSHIQEARINKTKWFFLDRESFMETLVKDIERLVRKADKLNMIAAVRLNGTSDIAWEKIACVKDGKKYKNVMEAMPDVQFYCYTKVLNRKTALALPNYHLTFSLSESNDTEAKKALEQGYNLAVVMRLKPSQPKPKTWWGYPVINGDESDVRFMDAKGGHIVALTAKGSARYDTSGFVRDAVQ
jgi:hypothetical protein